MERLEEQLVRRCLPRPLELAPDGSVPCTLVEVRPHTQSCSCDASRARVDPPGLIEENVRRQLASSLTKPCGAEDPECRQACLCQVNQITAEPALSACRNDENPTSAEGWCYVADSDDQHIGSATFVADCRSTERQVVRLVGEGQQKGR